MHTASIVEISDHMPLKIEFIDSPEKSTRFWANSKSSPARE